MKTVAAVVIVLALVGLFGKSKKKEQPPKVYTRPPAAQPYSSENPEVVPTNEASEQRISSFGKTLYRQQVVSDEVLAEVAHYIVIYSTADSIEPELAAALIARESGFNPNAVSRSGAKGLGQLIDSTARNMGVTDSFDIQQNLNGSLGYFKQLLDKWQSYPDQADRAICSYLQGPKVVENAGGVTDSCRQYISEIMGYRLRMLAM